MKKTKIFSAIALAVFATLVFCVFASAEEVASGYNIAKGGGETNVKWTLDSDGVLKFEIDASATDKKPSTSVYATNASGNVLGYGKASELTWGANKDSIKKVIVGDGIEALVGGVFNCCGTITSVEIPKSLTKIEGAVFEGAHGIKSIYYTGNEPVNGEFDISTVTEIGDYAFDNAKGMTSVKLSDNLTGGLKNQSFKYTAIKEIRIPAGVNAIGNQSFINCSSLTYVYIYSKEYTLADTAFNECPKITKIYGYAGTAAENFCRNKDISFVNIETNEYIYKSTNEPETFDPTGATKYGLLYGEYKGTKVVDTYWAYYADTKTLKFTSNGSGYNETGTVKYDKDGAWTEYKQEIEHIVIGTGISKVTREAFKGMTALKDVVLGKSITQLDAYAFSGCTSLTTVNYAGNEAVEYTADISKVNAVNEAIFSHTAIKNFIFSPKTTAIGSGALPPLTASITCTPNDDFIEYAKNNYLDIIDVATGETVFENYVEVDPNLPSCGAKTVFAFDEATGTLTISGAGAIGDIVNYYGGGSKSQYWFDVKMKIKKVVIGDKVTGIGKYAFTQCKNIEYVELSKSPITIGNAAFENCENLKAIYISGSEPIIGTADLSTVKDGLEPWTFSKCYLIANIVFGDSIAKVGDSAFEESVNVENIYGAKGGYAETYAESAGYTFKDISAEKPTETICEKPEETSSVATDTASVTETAAETEPDTDAETKSIVIDIETDSSDTDGGDGGNQTVTIIVIAVCAAVILIAAVAVVIIKNKKNKK